jgi:hypothetical protein
MKTIYIAVLIMALSGAAAGCARCCRWKSPYAPAESTRAQSERTERMPSQDLRDADAEFMQRPE